MSEERDETGLVRAACWRLCDAKDSYSCAILCEGWGGVVEWRGGVEWRGEGTEGDGKESVGVVDEGIANVADGDCDIWSKMAGGCTASKCSTTEDKVCSANSKTAQITFLSTPNLPHTISDQDPMTTEKRALTLRVVQVYQAAQVEPCPVTNCPCLIATAVNKRQIMTITLLPLDGRNKIPAAANDRQ